MGEEDSVQKYLGVRESDSDEMMMRCEVRTQNKLAKRKKPRSGITSPESHCHDKKRGEGNRNGVKRPLGDHRLPSLARRAAEVLEGWLLGPRRDWCRAL